MKFISDFMLLFLLIFLFELFYVNKFKKDFNKLKETDPVVIFVLRYNIDLSKVSYVYLNNVLAFVNSFIISLSATIITNIDNILLSLVICFIVLCCLLYILYEITGKYFKKLEAKEKVVRKRRKKRKNKKSEGEENV